MNKNQLRDRRRELGDIIDHAQYHIDPVRGKCVRLKDGTLIASHEYENMRTELYMAVIGIHWKPKL